MQDQVAEFILETRPSAVVVETSLNPEHGTATGNVLGVDTEVNEFFLSIFQQLGRQMAGESEPAKSPYWQVVLYVQALQHLSSNSGLQNVNYSLCQCYECTIAQRKQTGMGFVTSLLKLPYSAAEREATLGRGAASIRRRICRGRRCCVWGRGEAQHLPAAGKHSFPQRFGRGIRRPGTSLLHWMLSQSWLPAFGPSQ